MKMEKIVYQVKTSLYEGGMLTYIHPSSKDTVLSLTASLSCSEVILMVGMVLLCVMMAFTLRHLVRQNARIAVLEEENSSLKACAFLNKTLSNSNGRKIRQQILPEIHSMKEEFARLSFDIQRAKDSFADILRNDEMLDNEIGEIIDLWDDDEEVLRLYNHERELVD